MCWGRSWSNRGEELRLLSLTAAGGRSWSVGLGWVYPVNHPPMGRGVASYWGGEGRGGGVLATTEEDRGVGCGRTTTRWQGVVAEGGIVWESAL